MQIYIVFKMVIICRFTEMSNVFKEQVQFCFFQLSKVFVSIFVENFIVLSNLVPEICTEQAAQLESLKKTMQLVAFQVYKLSSNCIINY